MDQLARLAFQRVTGEQLAELQRELSPRLVEIDESNTRRIQGFLETRSWFNISQYGQEADSQAWLLVQHADRNPDFQREVLKRLQPLVARGETDPRNFAYLTDRVAASYNDPSKRTPQTYGTQGHMVEGSFVPYPMIDPEHVDERRASVGLGPLSEYIQEVNKIYGPK
ncbi:hypothetical protein JST97_35030 [bacterium]|nr:hypothetical protein [bacterium]